MAANPGNRSDAGDKRVPMHLCPWCGAHVDEHDSASLAACSAKWRARETGKSGR